MATTSGRSYKAEEEDTSSYDIDKQKQVLTALKEQRFVFDSSVEDVVAFGYRGCTIRNTVISFWREHFIKRENMHEVYFPTDDDDDDPWSIVPFTDFENLYRLNEITKLPFAAAQLTQYDLVSEESPQHCPWSVDDSTFAEIEHFMDSQDRSHPKFYQVSSHKLHHSIDPQGIANDQTLTYFLKRVEQFLTHVGIDPKKLLFTNDMASGADCWVAKIDCSYGSVECVKISRGCAYPHQGLDYEQAMAMKDNLEQEGGAQLFVTTTPSLIKMSFCIGRIISCLYDHSFCYNKNKRLGVFHFPPLLAPIKCVISVTEDKFKKFASSISEQLEAACVAHMINSGPLASTDELGVPLAVIVNSETSVTICDRYYNTDFQPRMEKVVDVVNDIIKGRHIFGPFEQMTLVY